MKKLLPIVFGSVVILGLSIWGGTCVASYTCETVSIGCTSSTGPCVSGYRYVQCDTKLVKCPELGQPGSGPFQKPQDY